MRLTRLTRLTHGFFRLSAERAPATRVSGWRIATLGAVGLVAGTLTFAACASPKAEANIAQALNDAANELNAMKSDIADMQAQLDSVRIVVAKQDTMLNRISAVTNIPR